MKVGLRCWATSHTYIEDKSATGFFAKNSTGSQCVEIEVAGMIWFDSARPESVLFAEYGCESEGDFIEAVRTWLKTKPSRWRWAAEIFPIEWQDFGLENVELYPREFDNPDFLYLENGEVV